MQVKTANLYTLPLTIASKGNLQVAQLELIDWTSSPSSEPKHVRKLERILEEDTNRNILISWVIIGKFRGHSLMVVVGRGSKRRESMLETWHASSNIRLPG